ncbi:hypothetical protein Ct9H90mP29_21980 [bacterium]|nr:MAG: hypothetical protein Ct9H90mP29_21980 [bacterium]
MFEQNPKTPGPSSTVKDLLSLENENQVEGISERQLDQPITSEQIEEEDLGLIDDQVEKFEDKSIILNLQKEKNCTLGISG